MRPAPTSPVGPTCWIWKKADSCRSARRDENGDGVSGCAIAHPAELDACFHVDRGECQEIAQPFGDDGMAFNKIFGRFSLCSSPFPAVTTHSLDVLGRLLLRVRASASPGHRTLWSTSQRRLRANSHTGGKRPPVKLPCSNHSPSTPITWADSWYPTVEPFSAR
jgi:hypothetical protein